MVLGLLVSVFLQQRFQAIHILLARSVKKAGAAEGERRSWEIVAYTRSSSAGTQPSASSSDHHQCDPPWFLRFKKVLYCGVKPCYGINISFDKNTDVVLMLFVILMMMMRITI